MPVISLVSAKGSPGVTTAAVALAAVAVAAGESVIWVELDPSGGSGQIQSLGSCPQVRPTLADLARALRDGRAGPEWVGLAVAAPPGVPAVLAPPGAKAASTLIAEGSSRWGRTFGMAEGLVVVDCGRWDPEQATAARLAGANVVGLVCRATVEGVEHARQLVPDLRRLARSPVAVVVVGTKPYPASDVARMVELPVAGVLEWRRNDVAALWAKGADRHGIGSMLGRSAGRVLDGLVGLLPPGQALAAVPSPGDLPAAQRQRWAR